MPQLNHTSNLRLFVLTLLLILTSLSCVQQQAAQAQRQTPTLTINRSQSATVEQLRADLAMRFMEPAPHMALARYFRDRGDRLEAFYILEGARRTRFPQEEFNQAFAAAFGRSQPPGASPEGEAAFNLGASLQREGKLALAEEQFVKAAALSPHSADIQAWVGRFFYKVKNDNRRALDYYLNAYLLDPDAYESEFVESRIPKIAGALAEEELARKLKGGAPLTRMVEDANPMVVLLALERMTEQWQPSYLPVMLSLMGHDEGAVRWEATEAIKQHADRSFDPTLRALLRDTDLRKRGLAAYIAAHLWRQESFPTLREMLNEQSQLLRFDAISALAIEGGDEGRKLIFEHLPREQNPRLRQMIESEMSRAPRQPELKRSR